MKKTYWLFAALALCLLVLGCVSSAIEKKFPERWEKTYIGMSLDEFKTVWPEAKYNGYGDLEQKTQVYSYAPLSVYTLNPRLEYFVFENDKLIRYYEQ
jgi:hypothetical protein